MIGKSRLDLLRREMLANNCNIYIIPSSDAHNSEYVPECWNRRCWISNFTGSSGDVVVSLNNAYLWTDGRYYIQANNELDCNEFTLLKHITFIAALEYIFINEQIKGEDLKVAVDPKVLSIGFFENIDSLVNKFSGNLVAHESNLIDTCKVNLGEDITPQNCNIFHLKQNMTGQSINEKIIWLQTEVSNKGANAIVLNMLDEIAWLFNMRGNDIEYNPLAIAYAIVEKSEIILFLNKYKIESNLKNVLVKYGVVIKEYDSFYGYLKKYTGVVWLSPKTSNYFILKCCKKSIILDTPIAMRKACKNEVEIKGARLAHQKDAVALINFLAWLDQNWRSGVNELNLVAKLREYRSEEENYKGDSFGTISAFAEHGAICHYQVNSLSAKNIDDTNLYLLDSGGQYLEGTTDVTRTIHLGEPTQIQKKHYTLVLKGHLALQRQKFPDGTTGESIDVLARSYLWNHNLDYMHGTGHGVGSFMCVHEGPVAISKKITSKPLKPGMILSNEPGVYLEGEYGIRIENLLYVYDEHESKNEIYNVRYYSFKNLTMVPYAKNLIDFSMLTKQEFSQIKDYYSEINEKIRPRLPIKSREWFDDMINI